MGAIKDIFFANVSGSHKDNHFLDLYLPDKYEVTQEVLDDSSTEQDDRSNVQFLKFDTDSEIYCQTRKDLPSIVDTDDAVQDTTAEDEVKNVEREAKVPLVIFVHGGGWRRGGRQAWTHFLYFDVNFLVVLLSLVLGTYGNVGQALANSGIACAVISYPLTEAGTVCLLTEICISYILSCLVVFLSITPVSALFFIVFRIPLSSADVFWRNLQFQEVLSPKTYILLIMFITNIVTLLLLTVKRREFRLKSYHIKLLWFCLVAGNLAIFVTSENKLLLLVLLSLVANQATILKVRLARCGGGYEDQTRVLAKAVRWAKTEGYKMGSFDTSRIYLMGHSAGGHLVSLTALDDDILATEGCSHRDIKGVVSLSGVYDLTCLCGPFLRLFYLQPTFGTSLTTWLRASPSHLVKIKGLRENKERPKFLLFIAERDFCLKQQSWQFSRLLQQAEVDCRHIEILGTNHMTIVMS